MNTKEKLRNLREFLLLNRANGNTTALVEIANNKKTTILAGNGNVAKYIKDLLNKDSQSTVFSINDSNFIQNARGKSLGTIVIDNTVVMDVVEESFKEIHRLENKIKLQEQFNFYMKQQMESFERNPEEFAEKNFRNQGASYRNSC